LGQYMIIIGTRGSALAMVQTLWIKQRILLHFPELEISVRVIKTSADQDKTTSLRTVASAGVFVKELEHALLNEEIDIAVHSMKDVPTQLAQGLHISAIPEREDARDALIANHASSLSELPLGSCVGTGSYRRQAQLLALRPDLKILDIRGNIDTRIKKMENGTCDAILLACAGLRRLGLQDRISAPFEYTQMLPAPGQGALAVETRIQDSRIASITSVVNHPDTANAVMAERNFLERLGGGCNVPIAIFARANQGMIEMDGLVASPDGNKIVRQYIQEKTERTDVAVASLSELILSQGGQAILEEFRLHK
jgi:hydroxymethylbilane synthase